jgi:diketogulonate reductase-like aldo/keto reductase
MQCANWSFGGMTTDDDRQTATQTATRDKRASSDHGVVMDRRRLLQAAVAGIAAGWCPLLAAATGPSTRVVPSSGERLPVVGLGSWITFNVGDDAVALDRCTDVVNAFLSAGGRMIDSSPMYGSAQHTIGQALRRLDATRKVFSADKVWIADADEGLTQIGASRKHWGVSRFDLLQVHNLLSWREHLRTLFALKEAGRLRHVGITTSEGRRHDEMERIMRTQPLDFVQFSYNVLDREAERRLLPLAQERGIAVICNRPFRQGALTRRLANERLPPLATALGCRSWAQLLLKFVLAHPAVTCAIPATSRIAHVRENVAAAIGPLPDARQRQALVQHVQSL